MRLLHALVLAFVLVLAATSQAHARSKGDSPQRAFGLGLVLGAPTGLAAKLYLARPMALAFGLGDGYGFHGHNGLQLHADVLWHPAVLARTAAFTLPFYLGVGGRVLSYDDYDDRDYDDDTHLGVRVPFGLLMDFHNASIDVFLELAVVVDFLHVHDSDYRHRNDDRSDLHGAFGFRYYF